MAIILKAKQLMSRDDARRQYREYMEQLERGLLILQADVEIISMNTEEHELEIIQGESSTYLEAELHKAERRIAELLDENIKLRRDRHLLEKRLQHLLLSDFIRSFDTKDFYTGEYVRDIRDVDKIAVPHSYITLDPIVKPKRFRWL